MATAQTMPASDRNITLQKSIEPVMTCDESARHEPKGNCEIMKDTRL